MTSDEHLSASAAAGRAGLSYSRMRELLVAGEIVAEQRGRSWWVAPDHLDRWIEEHRLVPGTLGPTTPGKPRRTNIELLDQVLALPGWDLDRLAIHLKTSTAKIKGWYQNGIPIYYLSRLRALLPDPPDGSYISVKGRSERGAFVTLGEQGGSDRDGRPRATE